MTSPCFTVSPSLTSTSCTVPGAPKFRLTLPAGSILPLALTEARMVPRFAAAVRSAAVLDVVAPRLRAARRQHDRAQHEHDQNSTPSTSCTHV